MPTVAFPTPFGPCALAWQEEKLTGFWLPPAEATDDTPPPPWVQTIVARVQRHLGGDFQDFSDLPYAFAGVSKFAADVYRETLAIKTGSTCSYGELARRLNLPPASSRAIGSALGANPWPLLVPCHRIVAGDGRMTGFSGPGGIRTKLRLLAIEGTQLFAE